MELTNEFEVAVPVEEAWEVLTDVERIAPLPSRAPSCRRSRVTSTAGIVKVKVGPITASYRGVAHFEEKDEAAHRGGAEGRGPGDQGPGQRLRHHHARHDAVGDGTKVEVVTDLAITGKVAQFGRGVLAEVSRQAARPVRAQPRDDGARLGPPRRRPPTSAGDRGRPAARRRDRHGGRAGPQAAAPATAGAAKPRPAARSALPRSAARGSPATAAQRTVRKRSAASRPTEARRRDRAPTATAIRQIAVGAGRAGRPRPDRRAVAGQAPAALRQHRRRPVPRADRRVRPPPPKVVTGGDRDGVAALLGGEPRGFEVAVRDRAGAPVVISNPPMLDDSTPMPTRYWLVGRERDRGRQPPRGRPEGCKQAEAAVDPLRAGGGARPVRGRAEAELPAGHRAAAVGRCRGHPPGREVPARPPRLVPRRRRRPVGRWVAEQLGIDRGA